MASFFKCLAFGKRNGALQLPASMQMQSDISDTLGMKWGGWTTLGVGDYISNLMGVWMVVFDSLTMWWKISGYCLALQSWLVDKWDSLLYLNLWQHNRRWFCSKLHYLVCSKISTTRINTVDSPHFLLWIIQYTLHCQLIEPTIVTFKQCVELSASW